MNKLLTVLLIAGLAAGAYFFLQEQENARKRAKQETNSAIALTKQHLKELQLALEEIRTPSGVFPDSLGELTEEKRSYYEPMSQSVFRAMSVDGWGQTMQYRAKRGKFYVGKEEGVLIYSTSHYELYSSGPDGIPWTSDDIHSWYIPEHDGGSIDRLAVIWSIEVDEASKSNIDRLVEKVLWYPPDQQLHTDLRPASRTSAGERQTHQTFVHLEGEVSLKPL